MPQKLSDGTVHKLPPDMRKAIGSAPEAKATWEDITPLARNEWICWTVTVKTAATRQNHVERTVSELKQGMRRPCCWIGCIHRNDKAISPSVRWVLSRKSGSEE